MAGRGTDIVLGGNLRPSRARARRSARRPAPEAAKADWQQRHDQKCSPPAACTSSAPSATSRGASTTSCAAVPAARATRARAAFYLSLEDNLMRIFGDPEPHQALADGRRHEGGRGDREPDAVAPDREGAAQGRGHNFDIPRKNLLEFDDVANDQRKVIYQQRTEIMGADDMSDAISGIRVEVVNQLIDQYVPRESAEDWNLDGLPRRSPATSGQPVEPKAWLEPTTTSPRRACASASSPRSRTTTAARPSRSAAVMAHLEKAVMLQELDKHWREHRRDGLPAAGHPPARVRAEEPEQEYKREAFEMFQARCSTASSTTPSRCCRGCRCAPSPRSRRRARAPPAQMARRLQPQHAAPQSVIAGDALPVESGGDSGGSPIPPGPCRRPLAAGARRPQGRPPTSRVPAVPAASSSTATASSPAKSAVILNFRGTPLTHSGRPGEIQECPISVVAGALFDADGRVLIAQRPAGKALAGRWEFPGGKLEPGEDPRAGTRAGVARGTRCRGSDAHRLLRYRHDYPAAPSTSTSGRHRLDRHAARSRGRSLKWVRRGPAARGHPRSRCADDRGAARRSLSPRVPLSRGAPGRRATSCSDVSPASTNRGLAPITSTRSSSVTSKCGSNNACTSAAGTENGGPSTSDWSYSKLITSTGDSAGSSDASVARVAHAQLGRQRDQRGAVVNRAQRFDVRWLQHQRIALEDRWYGPAAWRRCAASGA